MFGSLKSFWPAAVLTLAAAPLLVAGGNPNAPPTRTPTYYDGKLFTIFFVELPPGGEQATLAHNGQLNFIYQSDQAQEEGFDFVDVIDAVPGDGMNPLWEEVQITFLTIPPQQFFSDDEINAAYAAGEIDLEETGELYRCPVIGQKP